MTVDNLIKELRQRQIDLGIIPKSDIDLVSDDAILECYATDSRTGKWLIPLSEINKVIDSCYNSVEFISHINKSLNK